MWNGVIAIWEVLIELLENRKEGCPSLAFEVVTGFDRQILGVSSARFVTQNDKQIVWCDETIQLIRNGW